MNRLTVFVLMLGLITIGGFIGCGDSDDGPTGPTLTVPHDLVAVALSSNAITLSWIEEDMSGYGYKVERGSGADWTEIGDFNNNTHSMTDVELDEGTTYQYRVKSYGRESESAPSVTATVTTLPLSPSSLSAERESTTSISLSWTNLTEQGTGVEIQRSLQAGSGYDSLFTVAADVEAYTDEGLEMRTTYYYRVRALQNGQPSLWSNVNSANTIVYTPFPPSAMEVNIMSDTEIQLRWNRQVPNPDGILIEMSLTGNGGWSVDSVAGNSRSYNASDLLSSTSYYFRGLAYNDFGNSEYSDVVSGQTNAGPPLAPSDFGAEAPDFSQVNLSWTDNSDDETGFYIQRKVAELPFYEPSVEISVDMTEWADETVRSSTTYDYRMSAYNDFGTSTWTSAVRVIVPVGPPNSPVGLIATAEGFSTIRLSWQPGSINDHGYQIERKAEGDDRFRLIDNEESQLYRDNDLDPETYYSYRIIAYREVDGDYLVSDPSEPDSAQTFSLIAFEDDYEGYEENQPPDNPAYEVNQVGSSSLRVTDESAHEGQLGLHFADPVANDGDLTRLWVRTRPMKKGNISMWIKIAPNGYFGFIGADPNDIITFQMQLNSDNTFAFRDGGAMDFSGPEYPVNEWAYFQFVFDFEAHTYDIFINEIQVTDSPSVQNDNLESNSVFIMLGYSNQTIEYVYVDELIFEDSLGEAERMILPQVPMLPAGLHKITDYNIFEIHKEMQHK